MSDTNRHIGILGLPIDNLTLEETVASVFDLCNDYLLDKRPRLVATVNVDFLVNLHSAKDYRIRHPELMAILRQADLITPDGMPLVWFSRLLGHPLKQRVTGADLVPALATEATRLKKSIYFLGGSGDVAKKAAVTLKFRNPKMQVAGYSSPFVHVEGEKLADEQQRDDEVVEQVNRSNADILLIAFGNPKQEIWFWRNRHRLKVPVSIGIGGTFNFVTGSVSRAPAWLQKSGLEWVYRITQDPMRLWRRYFYGIVKLSAFVLPILPQVLVGARKLKEGRWERRPLRYRYGQDKTSVILPAKVTAAIVRQLDEELAHCETSHIELNFHGVRHLDIAAIGELLSLRRSRLLTNCALSARNVSLAIQKVMIAHRSYDVFDMNYLLEYAAGSEDDEVTPNTISRRGYRLEANEHRAVIIFKERLDALRISRVDSDGLFEKINNLDVIVDLSNVRFVDSSAIGFLVKIKRISRESGNKVVICGMQEMVQQVFRMTRMELVFDLAPTLSAADDLLSIPS
ncbi:MAG: WecB/TagA/CpsF family glycosyltransferase [Calditrichia bacterium]